METDQPDGTTDLPGPRDTSGWKVFEAGTGGRMPVLLCPDCHGQVWVAREAQGRQVILDWLGLPYGAHLVASSTTDYPLIAVPGEAGAFPDGARWRLYPYAGIAQWVTVGDWHADYHQVHDAVCALWRGEVNHAE